LTKRCRHPQPKTNRVQVCEVLTRKKETEWRGCRMQTLISCVDGACGVQPLLQVAFVQMLNDDLCCGLPLLPMRFSLLVYCSQILSPRLGRCTRLWYRTPGYLGWRAGTTTLCQNRLYPLVRVSEFGLWFRTGRRHGSTAIIAWTTGFICTDDDWF
jgi:hypothetical protein